MIDTKTKNVGDSTIACPSCGHHFDVEEAIEKKAEQRLREEFNQRFLHLKRKEFLHPQFPGIIQLYIKHRGHLAVI